MSWLVTPLLLVESSSNPKVYQRIFAFILISDGLLAKAARY